jgi:type VI secretion system secreted protein VgrG
MVKFKHNEPHFELQLSEIEDGVLRVLSFDGEEAISRPFEYRIELLSDDPEIDPAKILNKAATFVLNRGDEDPVKIHGVISDFEQHGKTARYVSYSAVLVPRLWRLTLTYRNEIYQKMNIEKLIIQVLKDSGFSGDDYKFDLKESYADREYIVQYRETNLNFINRRLEFYGIYYFFDHSGDKDVVVFSDHNDTIQAIASKDDIFYNPNLDPLSQRETIQDLVFQSRVVTGAVRLKDFNYRTPSKDLVAESQIDSDAPGLYYEYGEHYKDTKEGNFLARVRNEEIVSRSKIFKGSSDCRLFRAGSKFKLDQHYRDEWNSKEYILTGIASRGTQRGLFATLPEARTVTPTFENTFEAIQVDVKFRPQRTTPIPRMYGIMNSVTQTVSGESYAHIDDQGRYRVKMPFDLSDSKEDEASAPIRLAAPHAGAGYGMHFPQHGGVEVVWACIDGNVDRPIGLGTVPNPNNPTPVSQGNNSANIINTAAGNILQMQDKGGGEQIKLSTPYSNTKITLGAPASGEGIFMTTDADLTANIGRDRKTMIGRDDSTYIMGKRKTVIEKNKEELVLKNEDEQIVGNTKKTVMGKSKLMVTKDHETDTGGNTIARSKKNIVFNAKQNVSAFAGDNIILRTMKKLKASAKEDISLETPKNLKVSTEKNANFLVTKHFCAVAKGNVAISSKDKITIKGNNEIQLKCGTGSIAIKKDGSIKIKGMKINIEGMTVNMKANAKGTISGSIMEIAAKGPNIISGTPVKIN